MSERPKWTDERGEMVLVMFALTVVLIGVAGVLAYLLDGTGR